MKAGVTKDLIDYCSTTTYELEYLRLFKIYYNLTDFGVKQIVDFAMPNAIPPTTVIEMLDYSE